MTQKPENPMAFPVLDNSGSGLCLREPGLTMRDYFAAYALQGLLASTQVHIEMESSDIAGYAFDIADAMLTARAKEPTQ